MLDASQIFEHIQDESEPERQEVIIAKNQISSVTIAWTLLSVITCNLIYWLPGSLLVYIVTQQPSYPMDIYTHYPLLAVLIQFMAVGLALLTKKRIVHLSDAALVFFPEGFVFYRGWSDKRRRKGREIGYKDIKEISLEGHMRVSLNLDARDGMRVMPPSEASLAVFWASAYLNVLYKNEKRETWYPATMFGSSARFDCPQDITRQIIQDYRAFKQDDSE